MKTSFTHFKKNAFTTLFPPPQFLSMPAVGLDVSSQSVRLMEFIRTSHGLKLGRFAERKIPAGVIYSDNIEHDQELKKAFQNIKRDFKLQFVSVSLPDEKAFLFRVFIPAVPENEIRTSIEFQLEENVPIAPEEAIFDYEVLNRSADKLDVMVAVFPRKIVQGFTQFLEQVGLVPVSFHVGANAAAQAIIAEGDMSPSLIVNIGDKNTGISVCENRVVQFTSNLSFGSENITSAIEKNFSVPTEQAIKMKQGGAEMKGKDSMQIFYSVMNPVAALRDEINRVLMYWQTRKIQDVPIGKKIEKIYVCGSDANLPGLDEYLMMAFQIPVEVANVWKNAFSLDTYTPPISFIDSLNYAPAIGLALDCIK